MALKSEHAHVLWFYYSHIIDWPDIVSYNDIYFPALCRAKRHVKCRTDGMSIRKLILSCFLVERFGIFVSAIMLQ